MNSPEKNSQYDPASSILRDPKIVLTSNNNSKLLFAIKLLTLLIVVGFGIYYFYIKNSSPNPALDPNLDTDKDGLPDRIEIAIGTDPNKIDTDGDTYLDLNEIKNGYDPLDPGAGKKYTEEQWNDLQARMMKADVDFYENLFSELEKKPGWNKLMDDHWFEIYYPKDWVVDYPVDSSNHVVLEFKRSETSEEKVSLTYFKNDDAFKAENGVSLEAYYNKAPIVEKKEMVAFGSNKFQKLIVHDCPGAGNTCTEYFYIYNGHIYQFEYEAESATINEIISTFIIVE